MCAKLKISCFLLLLVTSVLAELVEEPGIFDQCLEKDSISCIQLAVFRQAKQFFEKPKIDIFGGLTLSKNPQDRQAKSIEDNSIAIETANSVEARNNELEEYFISNIKRFFQERSLSFNFVEAARSISNAIPEDIKTDIKDLVVEGRGKRRKILRRILPILLGLKLKMKLILMVIIGSLFFLAKKALVISIAALVLAVLSALQHKNAHGGGSSLFSGLFGSGSSYSSGSWAPAGGSGWSAGWDSHGAYSAPVAQTLAYSGHKQARR